MLSASNNLIHNQAVSARIRLVAAPPPFDVCVKENATDHSTLWQKAWERICQGNPQVFHGTSQYGSAQLNISIKGPPGSYSVLVTAGQIVKEVFLDVVPSGRVALALRGSCQADSSFTTPAHAFHLQNKPPRQIQAGIAFSGPMVNGVTNLHGFADTLCT